MILHFKRLVFLIVLSAVCTPLIADSLNILILHSFHEGYKWTDDINEEVKKALLKQDPGAQFHVEYMDAKRVPSDILTPDLYALYMKKYGYQSFDLIILSDNIALEFMKDYRNEIFGQVPTFFCGVNDFSPSSLEEMTNITGITEDTDMAATVDLILQLQPDVHYLAGITDFISDDQSLEKEFRNLQSSYSGRLEFLSFSSLSEEELVTAMEGLPQDSDILYFSFFKDRERLTYSVKDSISLVTDATPLPVYTLWDWGIGQGTVPQSPCLISRNWAVFLLL